MIVSNEKGNTGKVWFGEFVGMLSRRVALITLHFIDLFLSDMSEGQGQLF